MIFSPNSDAGSVFFGGSGDGHWDFRYNGRSELTGGMRKTGTSLGAGNLMDPGDFDYIYDPIGNRESYRLDGGTATTYTTNNLNQYTATADPTEYFCYDADGNLIADGKPTSDCNTANGAWAYTWDGENRLIRVEPAGTPASGDKKLEFQYDYRSRRVRKTSYTHNGSAWIEDADLLFVYDDWNVVLVLDANDDNEVTHKHTWGLDLSGLSGNESVSGIHNAGGIGGLLAIEDVNAGGGSANSYWYFYDANGNVGQLVSATGNFPIAAQYENDAYGSALVASGTYAAANPFRFSTKWFEGEFELYYYGYRYYSAGLGRWISRDPIGERGGTHLCRAFANSPTSFTDGRGLCVIGSTRNQVYTESCGLFGCGVRDCRNCDRCVWTPNNVPGRSQSGWRSKSVEVGKCVSRSAARPAPPACAPPVIMPKCNRAAKHPTKGNCMDCCDEAFGIKGANISAPGQFVEECYKVCGELFSNQ